MALRRRDLLSGLAATACIAARRKPNIVLLLADDLGYGELGCQGNAEIPTPHIDSIAQRGVRFTNGYVTAPYCCPSRAGILTGRYQTRFGCELNPVGKQNLLPGVGLPESEKTMAAYLKEAGYRTGLIGKWHLGGTEKYHPLTRGFDEFYGFLHEGHFYQPRDNAKIVSRLRKNEPPYDDENPVMRGREAIVEPEYFTRALAREACGFIDRSANRPFFLYLPFNAVHSPMQAEPRDLDRFAHIADPHRRIFAAMLSVLDEAVGRVLAKLRETKLERDTMVVFLSDNGGPTAELTSSNKPLRAGKGQLYEGGIRVPFLMRYPAGLRAGRVENAPVTSLDLMPTFLRLAGVGKALANPLDGMDLMGLRRERTLYWRYGGSGALRMGDWKVVRQNRPRQEGATWELFDLAKDPTESRDLAQEQPGRAKLLVERWTALDGEMSEPGRELRN
jgi:arylsulfatase A-like enzyme